MVVELLRDLGVFTIAGGSLYLIARSGIQQYFDKELKRYQTELDKERVRFSELQQRRGEKTEQLYKKLVTFEEDMRSLTNLVTYDGEPNKDEKMKEAQKSGREFANFYMENKIYFPPDACETIEEIQKVMKGVFDTYRIERPHESRAGNPPDIDTLTESWKKISEDEVQDLKAELETQFRELLGVDTN